MDNPFSISFGKEPLKYIKREESRSFFPLRTSICRQESEVQERHSPLFCRKRTGKNGNWIVIDLNSVSELNGSKGMMASGAKPASSFMGMDNDRDPIA